MSASGSHLRTSFFSSLQNLQNLQLPLFFTLEPRRAAGSSSLFFNKPTTFICLSARPYSKRRTPRMPPKKAKEEEKILLGRPGNNLKSGIVGCLW